MERPDVAGLPRESLIVLGALAEVVHGDDGRSAKTWQLERLVGKGSQAIRRLAEPLVERHLAWFSVNGYCNVTEAGMAASMSFDWHAAKRRMEADAEEGLRERRVRQFMVAARAFEAPARPRRALAMLVRAAEADGRNVQWGGGEGGWKVPDLAADDDEGAMQALRRGLTHGLCRDFAWALAAATGWTVVAMRGYTPAEGRRHGCFGLHVACRRRDGALFDASGRVAVETVRVRYGWESVPKVEASRRDLDDFRYDYGRNAREPALARGCAHALAHLGLPLPRDAAARFAAAARSVLEPRPDSLVPSPGADEAPEPPRL
jgi:hypothetical protein